MSALTTAGEPPPVCGGSPGGAPGRRSPRHRDMASGNATRGARLAKERDGRVWLHVQVGSGEIRRVPLIRSRFVIGREQGCNLRLGSAQVSKHHAAIERRQGRVFLVDLGSTNGTIVGGRLIRGQEVEISRRRSDPVRADRLDPVDRARRASRRKRWRITPRSGCRSKGLLACHRPASRSRRKRSLSPRSSTPGRRIKCEVIQEVLVVTPQLPEMDGRGGQ